VLNLLVMQFLHRSRTYEGTLTVSVLNVPISACIYQPYVCWKIYSSI